MAVVTDGDLNSIFQSIRTEVANSGNTKTRIATALQDLFDTLNARILLKGAGPIFEPFGSYDANDYTNTGIYHFSVEEMVSNFPSALISTYQGLAVLTIFKVPAIDDFENRLIQILTVEGGLFYTRTRLGNGTWQSWTQQGSDKQPLDADLTQFAGLTPSDNDILQRKSGNWVNRTIAQLKADLGFINDSLSTSSELTYSIDKILSLIATAKDKANWKQGVKAATTTNITLSGTQTIDDISCVVDDRVLVKDQIDVTKNGIYLVKSSAWVRASDYNEGDEISMSVVPVGQGTVNADTNWICINDGTIDVGTTNLSFTALGGSVPDATESIKGKAELATNSETQAGSDDTRIVTPLKLANWWTNVKTLAQTFAAKITFTEAPRFSSVTASQYLKVDSNKDVMSVAGVPAADVSESGTQQFVSYTDKTTWNAKQEALVSGTNVKTLNNQSILGAGNVTIDGLTQTQKTLLDELELRLYI